MKKTFKQLISVLLSLMLVFGALPMTVLAANGTCGSGVYWTLTDGTLAITGNGQMDNYSSTTDAPWQEYADEITAVNVAGTVTRIGNYAFWGIEGITSVTLNEGLQNIGTYVFNYCTGLTELELPASLDGIGNAAFGNSGIKKITFNGNYMSAVGNNTFKTISNVKIIVPAGFEIGGNYGGTAVAAKTGAQPFYNNYVGFSNGKATVYWENDDGTVLATDANVTNGSIPVYSGETPTKQSTQTVAYTFAGWDPTPSAVSQNNIYIYTATYNEEAIVPAVFYTVTWKDAYGENVLGTDSVQEGNAPVYSGTTPQAPEDDYSTYTFSGWRDDNWNEYAADALPAVTGDVTYYALFSATMKHYDIVWKNWDGTVLETDDDVEAAGYPTYDGETPVRQEDENYIYAFRGWTPSVEPVHCEAVYTATYTKTKKNVSYIDANGTQQTVNAVVLDGGERRQYYDYSSTVFIGEEGQTTWYVVEDDVVYDDSLSAPLRIRGNVNLILADGASLTCDEIKTPYTDNARSLSIYGQSATGGTLTVDKIYRYYQFDTLNIYDVNIIADIENIDTVNMVRGSLASKSVSADEFNFYGGNVTVSEEIEIPSILFDPSGTEYSMSFGNALKCERDGVFVVADGKTITDGETQYTGTNDIQSELAGKTLRLYQVAPAANDIYNLTVQENIDVNILIDVAGHLADGEEIEKIVYSYPDITKQDKGTPVTETVNAADITTDAGGYYAKSFTLAIAQANEPIVATVYFTNGTTTDKTVSVADYCKYVVDNAATNGYSEKLVNLCYAVLEYCKNAADYFNYSYDAYPTYTLPSYFDAEPVITSQAGISKGSVATQGVASTQMFILSNAKMRLTFKDDLSSVSVVGVKINGAEREGLNAELTQQSDGRWSADITGIKATELNKPILLELSDGTKVQYAATDWAKSVLTYSTSEISKALAKSMYYYSKAANEYFA